MLKPSAIRFAKPSMTATKEGKPAPTEPETTANVVIHPSMPPNTASDIFRRLGSKDERLRITSG